VTPRAQLHSRYNPQSEAERYIGSLNLKDDIECFILIEPGLGYMIPVLQEKFKQSKIIALYVDDSNQSQQTQIPSFYCAQNRGIQEFVETHTEGIDTEHIKIIEWRPSLNFYKEAYVKLLSQVVQCIKRTEAGKRTASVFGRRWFKNFFRNLGLINKSLLYRQVSLPVIVIGSGPGLENDLDVVRNSQSGCLVIAASSSVMALSSRGITPDIIIATDGGSWALKHIYQCCRAGSKIFAVNLCAALPSQFAEKKALLINDGSFWQNIIFHELSMPSVIIGQTGTVSAAAVELAVILSAGDIYVSGMDFSADGIKTHVRPYAFENLFYEKADRFLPFYSQSYKRSTLLKEGGSLDIYASWFKNKIAAWPKRIFAISRNNIFEDKNPVVNAVNKKNAGFFTETNCRKAGDNYIKKALSALTGALNDPEYSRNIIHELTPLLFPGKKEVTALELEKEIRETINSEVYYG